MKYQPRINEGIERWREIPGYGGLYQASTEGRICKVLPDGQRKILVPYIHMHGSKRNPRTLVVHIKHPDGRRVQRPVMKLVAETWCRRTDGKIPIHKNGDHHDNSVRNISFITHRECGQRFGAASGRRPVVKIDRDGEIIACYSSARAAARENYVSYQTVLDRCHNKVKNSFALDGTSYRWEERCTD